MLWHERGFLTSSGTPIKKDTSRANLLKSILLPSAIAVIKRNAHTGISDDVSKDNASAEEDVKQRPIPLTVQ